MYVFIWMLEIMVWFENGASRIEEKKTDWKNKKIIMTEERDNNNQ